MASSLVPVEMTSSSVPAEMASSPVTSSSVPVEMASSSVTSTSVPVEMTSSPVTSSSVPVEMASSSVPVGLTSKSTHTSGCVLGHLKSTYAPVYVRSSEECLDLKSAHTTDQAPHHPQGARSSLGVVV